MPHGFRLPALTHALAHANAHGKIKPPKLNWKLQKHNVMHAEMVMKVDQLSQTQHGGNYSNKTYIEKTYTCNGMYHKYVVLRHS